MKKWLLPACIFLAALSSCITLPKKFQTKDEVIRVGPGPEDMVADTVSEQPRLLISCCARRANEPYYGEINMYYPATGTVKVLKRHEPADVHFYPHGIDLVKVKDTLVLLVVNNDNKHNEQSILRYRVFKDSLLFLNKITDPLIVSPNAVTGFADGTMLISNDMGKAGNFMEALFILKRAQIIYWDKNKCSVAAGKFCYSNGITNRNGKVYLASTRQNKIWQFDFSNGKMINKQVLAKVHGPDNLRFDGNGLLVACHLRFLDFLGHMKDSTHYSPTTVYRVDLNSHQTNVVYFDDGRQLSAASTGLVYGGYLYAGGVFDGKMVRKKE
jgi:SMP-30/Gluconolactonase/LRE-like region